MDITSAQGFLQFITSVRDSRGGVDVQSLIAELKSNNGPGIGKGRNKRAESPQEAVPESSADSPDEAETVEEPTQNTTPSTSASATNDQLSELATLYVEQYEQGSGVSLSTEAFEQKKAEIVDLYSRLGADRLDNIVFSNDIDETA